MIKKVCSLIIIIFTIFNMCSCFFSPESHYEFIEDDDYIFAYHKSEGFEISNLYLYGLTDSGKEKEYLILPEKYKDKKIDCFGIGFSLFMAGRDFKDEFSSDVLKKVFINFKLEEGNNWTGVSKNKDGNTYTFVLWYDYDKNVIDQYLNRINEAIIGYNLFDDFTLMDRIYKTGREVINYIANVSYIYNYDDAPNGGYYWVDNYDNSLIEYIPPEPTREGYTFDGWYKEEDCINKWDFTSDKTSPSYTYYVEPNEYSTEYSSEEYREFYDNYISTHTYVETKLYAKWVKA